MAKHETWTVRAGRYVCECGRVYATRADLAAHLQPLHMRLAMRRIKDRQKRAIAARLREWWGI